MNPEEIENDREIKQRLVLATIRSYCNENSEFQDFRTIAAAIAQGDDLDIKIIAGGCTNFSYKVFLHNDESKAPLFAKLSFPYALWNPDPDAHYDLERTENEFLIMKKVSTIVPDAPVAMPYLCVTLDDMKLLVTEWSKADEQWANQFIDGNVDMRVIPKLAQTLAILHCQDFDPEFNENVRPCMLSLFPTMNEKFDKIFQDPEILGRTPSLIREYGKEVCSRIVEKNLQSYNERQCLVHSDTHAFNILVEGKPDVSLLENFGPNGDLVLCDWEMVFAGPIGRDVGLAYSWPISCMLSHALNGHVTATEEISKMMDLLWSEYSLVLKEEGSKDEKFLCDTYRNILAWCGWFLFQARYVLQVQAEFLPADNDEDRNTVVDSNGVVGLKLMKLGFDIEREFTIEELENIFKKATQQEIDHLLGIARTRKRRQWRSSMLRASGRRVSDAAMHFSSRSLLSQDARNYSI